MNDESAIAEIVNSVPEESSSSEVSSATEAKPKLFTSEQATQAVLKERARAYEKGRRDAFSELDKPKPEPEGSVSAIKTDDFKKLVESETSKVLEERATKQQEEERATRIKQAGQEIQSKLSAAIEAIPELTDTLRKIDSNDPAANVIMLLANDVENTADVIGKVFEDDELTARLTFYAESGRFDQLTRAISKINASVEKEKTSHQDDGVEPLMSVNPAKRAKIPNSDMRSASELRRDPRFKM